MPKFLHLADIHLGFDRYQSVERTRDFFYAFQDVLQKYAIDEDVDFVLIAGDLFEHRSIQPNVLNQAKVCLQDLQRSNIPVIAIEGNHDNRPYGTRTSWLKHLSDWGFLILLEPEPDFQLKPWDGKQGGYIDLECGVRVIGSSWYGASAPSAILSIAEAITQLPSTSFSTILLFHHGLEDQIARYKGALKYNDLLPLKKAGVDYLALGHIHKNYSVEEWIFNPGSIEANSVEESTYHRGAYLVECSEKSFHAELKEDYWQRPIKRLTLTVDTDDTPETIQNRAFQLLETKSLVGEHELGDSPVVELKIQGTASFDRSHLSLNELRETLKKMSGAIVFLLKYEANETTFESYLDSDSTRSEIEREIFLDLLVANRLYKKKSPQLADGLLQLKHQSLDQPDSVVYDSICELLTD